MLLALTLIIAVSAQTTKSESGLSGAIGGKSSSSFRGRPGLDDQLSKITKWAAVAFMIVSVGVAIAVNKGL
jgi:protein translocase SecG subunit